MKSFTSLFENIYWNFISGGFFMKTNNIMHTIFCHFRWRYLNTYQFLNQFFQNDLFCSKSNNLLGTVFLSSVSLFECRLPRIQYCNSFLQILSIVSITHLSIHGNINKIGTSTWHFAFEWFYVPKTFSFPSLTKKSKYSERRPVEYAPLFFIRWGMNASLLWHKRKNRSKMF